MKHGITSFILVAFLFVGCGSTRVQLYEVGCRECTVLGPYLASENDTVRVVYYFWAENGIMGFSIQNKLKIPVYVDWKKCAYIIGTKKFDYWNENETVTTSSESVTSWTKAFNWLEKNRGTSTSVIYTAERVSFIPPGTAISRFLFQLAEKPLKIAAALQGESHDTSISMWNEYMKKLVTTEFNYQSFRFTQETTPLKFRSFLTYSTDEKFSAESYIDSEFHIAKLTSMPLKLFDPNSTTSKPAVSPWQSPKAFFLKFADGK